MGRHSSETPAHAGEWKLPRLLATQGIVLTVPVKPWLCAIAWFFCFASWNRMATTCRDKPARSRTTAARRSWSSAALKPRKSVRRLTPSTLAASSALRPSLFISWRARRSISGDHFRGRPMCLPWRFAASMPRGHGNRLANGDRPRQLACFGVPSVVQ